MIDDKIWGAYAHGGVTLEYKEILDALKETFACPRCGRPDLPLALFPHHNKSCAFECGIGMAPIQKIEEQQQRIDDLESALETALSTINWFGGWLNSRKVPISYDNSQCECGHDGRDHTGLGRCTDPDDSDCNCDVYRPTDFSVSYDARGVAIATREIHRVLGTKDFRCWKCRGKFDLEHRTESGRCVWCDR